MKKMFNEGNQIHNFMSCSGSGTVINYGSGSGSNFLTSYGSGSGSTSQKVPVPTVPVPVPQHCRKCLKPDKQARSSLSKAEYLTCVASSFLEKNPRGRHGAAGCGCFCNAAPMCSAEASTSREFLLQVKGG